MEARLDPGRFAGRRVYAIGGGASLRGLDLDGPLAGHPVIGCNDAMLRYACARIGAFGDWGWWQRRGSELEGSGVEAWSNCNAAREVPGVNWLRKSARMSKSPDAAAWWGNTGYLALQLALLWGPREIVLLGYDMRLVDGRSNWHDDNPSSPTSRTYDSMLRHAGEIARDARRLFPGTLIVNADPVSRLTPWPVADPRDYGIEVPVDHLYRRTR